MDSHRESRPEIGRGWRVKHTFTTVCPRKFFVPVRMMDFEKVEQAVAGKLLAAQSPLYAGLPPGANDRVSNCIHDINLTQKARLTCPKCGNTDPRRLVFQNDPPVKDPDDVGRTEVMCVHDQGTAQFGGGPVVCGHKEKLYDYMDSREHPLLHKDVLDWMTKMGIATPSANSFPSPYAMTAPQFQSAVAQPKPIGQVVQEQMAGLKESLSEQAQREAEAFYGTETSEPTPEPTCEADKPEGTRDVEKFLKEQQEKLWRGD